MGLVWMVIPLALIGIAMFPNAYATSCDYSFEYSLFTDDLNMAMVIAEITDIKTEIYDPPLYGHNTIYDKTTVSFTIDEVVHSYADFDVASDTVAPSNYENRLEVGQKIGVFYLKGEEWHPMMSGICNAHYPETVKNYIEFFVDLRDNPCDPDKDYLIKRSNDKKVCLNPETADILEHTRGYGYRVSSLEFYQWEYVSQGKTVYSNESRCYGDTYLVRGYCLPGPPPIAQEDYETQTKLSEKSALSAKIIHEPIRPNKSHVDGPVTITVDFIHPQSQKLQEHVDYKITASLNGETIFGPTPLIHTSTGSASIPIEFSQGEGTYNLDVEIHGILFVPISVDVISFEILTEDK